MHARYGRWLLLDLGGVIEQVDDDTWPGEFRRSWARRLGICEDEFSARLAAADLPPADRQGTEGPYWAAIRQALGLDADTSTAMQCDFWDRYCGTRNDHLVHRLAELKGHVGLAVLSNSADGARREEERRFGLSRLFDPILYSHEIGVTKPDPRAYEIAVRRLGAPPHLIMFIDDHVDNVEAAARHGMVGHHHTGNAATLAAIDRFVDCRADTVPGHVAPTSS